MKSTLKWFAAALMLFATLVPGPAMARNEKSGYVSPDTTCSSCITTGGGTDVKSVRVSRGSDGGMAGGWRCKLKGDEYDQFRVVQNKSSLKNAQTFFRTSLTSAGGQVATGIATLNPLVLFNLLVHAFNTDAQSENMKAQQKYACERLELEIKNKKEVKQQIADIGKKNAEQIKGAAQVIGQQIPGVVDSRLDAWWKANKDAVTDEVARKAYLLSLIEQDRRGLLPGSTPEERGSQAQPEAIPDMPERKPPMYGPEVPSVQAPLLTPAVPSQAVPPAPAMKVDPEQTAEKKPPVKQARRDQ